MLKKFAIALIAAGLVTAPAFATTSASTSVAQPQIKHVKAVKHHVRHAKKRAVKQQTSRKHHVRHVRAHVKPAPKKPG